MLYSMQRFSTHHGAFPYICLTLRDGSTSAADRCHFGSVGEVAGILQGQSQSSDDGSLLRTFSSRKDARRALVITTVIMPMGLDTSAGVM